VNALFYFFPFRLYRLLFIFLVREGAWAFVLFRGRCGKKIVWFPVWPGIEEKPSGSAHRSIIYADTTNTRGERERVRKRNISWVGVIPPQKRRFLGSGGVERCFFFGGGMLCVSIVETFLSVAQLSPVGGP
jgi:hypothetical protein